MCEAGGRGNAYDTRSQERLLRTAGEALEEPLSVDECLERAGGWGAYQRSLMLTLGTSRPSSNAVSIVARGVP